MVENSLLFVERRSEMSTKCSQVEKKSGQFGLYTQTPEKSLIDRRQNPNPKVFPKK